MSVPAHTRCLLDGHMRDLSLRNIERTYENAGGVSHLSANFFCRKSRDKPRYSEIFRDIPRQSEIKRDKAEWAAALPNGGAQGRGGACAVPAAGDDADRPGQRPAPRIHTLTLSFCCARPLRRADTLGAFRLPHATMIARTPGAVHRTMVRVAHTCARIPRVARPRLNGDARRLTP